MTDALSGGPEESRESNRTTENKMGGKALRFPQREKYNSEGGDGFPKKPRQRGKQEKIYRNTIGNSGGAAQTELHLGLFLVPDAVNNITLSLFVL